MQVVAVGHVKHVDYQVAKKGIDALFQQQPHEQQHLQVHPQSIACTDACMQTHRNRTRR
jgi:hypothetical protein